MMWHTTPTSYRIQPILPNRITTLSKQTPYLKQAPPHPMINITSHHHPPHDDVTYHNHYRIQPSPPNRTTTLSKPTPYLNQHHHIQSTSHPIIIPTWWCDIPQPLVTASNHYYQIAQPPYKSKQTPYLKQAQPHPIINITYQHHPHMMMWQTTTTTASNHHHKIAQPPYLNQHII